MTDTFSEGGGVMLSVNPYKVQKQDCEKII